MVGTLTDAMSTCMLVTLLVLAVASASAAGSAPTEKHRRHHAAHNPSQHDHQSKHGHHTDHPDHQNAHHLQKTHKKDHGDEHKHQKNPSEHRHAKGKQTEHTTEESCEKLINHGTHFTVELEVGNPPQKFAVVADTGSDAILIPSCQCVEDMYCSNESRCFVGSNKSSTFSYKKNKKGEPLNSIRMMFGSGPVEAVVVSDEVSVGNLKVMMNDAVLLMTDHMLNIKGPFEGILGLGLPASSVKNGLYKRSSNSDSGSLKDSGRVNTGPQQHQHATKYTMGYSSSKPGQSSRMPVDPDTLNVVSDHRRHLKDRPILDYSPMMNIALPERVVQVEASASLLQVTRPLQKKAHFDRLEEVMPDRLQKSRSPGKQNSSSGIVVKGFAENAGISRFSMCFNDGAPGVLRLQSKKAAVSHGSVGQVHWGLDFRGISVGSQQVPVKMCQKEDLAENQSTPCGAIPDSGTTALMGPKEHILALYESICDEWDRCKQNHTAFQKARDKAHEAAVKEYGVDPFELQNASKGMIFQMLLMDCHSWWVNGTGLDELPDLRFHIRGVNGTAQDLALHGWSYVIETYEKDFTTIYKDIEGVGSTPVGRNFTGGSHKVCSPAFSTMDYQTQKNGPVWILGTPIFYEYQVGYDYKASPPSMSFDDTECGTCESKKTSKKKTSLASVDSRSGTQGTHASASASKMGRRPRQVFGKFRVPNIDVSQPL